MVSKKLKEMISSRPGGMKSFSEEVGIPNSTLFNSLKSDEHFYKMPIDNFIKVSRGLGMTADELLELLEEE